MAVGKKAEVPGCWAIWICWLGVKRVLGCSRYKSVYTEMYNKHDYRTIKNDVLYMQICRHTYIYIFIYLFIFIYVFIYYDV